MANEGRPPPGLGCLGSIIGAVVLVAVVVLVFFVGFIVLGIVAALFVIGLVVLAVDRLLLALSPGRRERRATQRRAFVWQFGAVRPEGTIDTTAFDTTVIDTTPFDTTVIDTTARPEEPGHDDPEPPDSLTP